MNKKRWLLAASAIGLPLIAVAWAITSKDTSSVVQAPEHTRSSPSGVVTQYWDLCEKGRFDEVREIVADVESQELTTPTEVNESARTNSNASIDFPEVNAPPGQHDREYVSAYLKSGFPKTIYEKHLELRKIETELLKDNKAIVIAVVRYRGEKFDFKMKHLLYNTNGEWKIANIKMYFDK